MTRAAIYLRVSKDVQSAENQLPALERIAAVRELRVVATFEEQMSAAKRRPKFDDMIRAAHAGEFKVLLIWALDRFGRSMVGNLQAVLELDRRGVQVVSVQEPWLDTGGPVRDLLIAIFSWVAEQERQRMIERTKAGLERFKKKGFKLGRPARRIDVARARRLKAADVPLREIAKRLEVPLTTLHRALGGKEEEKYR